MNERIIESEEVLSEVMDEYPNKVLVMYLVDDELVIKGNMTYIESLGTLELAKDQVKEILAEEE